MPQLENWETEAGASSSAKGAKQQLEIVLPVPAGQEDLAELLIKGEHRYDYVLPLYSSASANVLYAANKQYLDCLACAGASVLHARVLFRPGTVLFCDVLLCSVMYCPVLFLLYPVLLSVTLFVPVRYLSVLLCLVLPCSVLFHSVLV